MACSLTALAFTPMGPRLITYNDTGSLEHLKPKPEQPKEEQQPKPEAASGEPAQPAAEAAAPPAAPVADAAAAPIDSANGVEEPAAPAA